MSKSPKDPDEQERAALRILVRQALADIERREEEARALREENARLKRLRDQPGRNSGST
jgi:cell shape-determining protein MreC